MQCGNCDAELIDRGPGRRAYPTCPACGAVWPDPKTLALVRRYRRPAPPATTVSIVYEPNGTAHDDIVLRVGKWASRCDSYYYDLDRPAGRRRGDVQASMSDMLTGWSEALVSCPNGALTYLPYGFWDQGSEWLRCTRHEGGFDVVAGSTSIEGWSFYPSDFSDKASTIVAFHIIDSFGPPLFVSEKLFLADLEASAALLEQ